MAFYKKSEDKLVRSVPFPKGDLNMSIAKTDDGKQWNLYLSYPDYSQTVVFKRQGDAKKWGQAFVYGFDSGLAIGTRQRK